MRRTISIRALQHVGKGYWRVVVIGGTLSLARFSEAFVLLKAREIGIAMMYVPLVLVAMNIVYSATAYPAGVISDRADRATVLRIGVVLLIAADVVLGFSTSIWTLVVGVSLWGLHLAFTQGQLSAMIADVTTHELRGSAYGVFNLISGLMMLVASVVAGVVWDAFGSSATLFIGAFFAILPLLTRQQCSPAALPGSNAPRQHEDDGGGAVG